MTNTASPGHGRPAHPTTQNLGQILALAWSLSSSEFHTHKTDSGLGLSHFSGKGLEAFLMYSLLGRHDQHRTPRLASETLYQNTKGVGCRVRVGVRFARCGDLELSLGVSDDSKLRALLAAESIPPIRMQS